MIRSKARFQSAALKQRGCGNCSASKRPDPASTFDNWLLGANGGQEFAPFFPPKVSNRQSECRCTNGSPSARILDRGNRERCRSRRAPASSRLRWLGGEQVKPPKLPNQYGRESLMLLLSAGSISFSLNHQAVE